VIKTGAVVALWLARMILIVAVCVPTTFELSELSCITPVVLSIVNSFVVLRATILAVIGLL